MLRSKSPFKKRSPKIDEGEPSPAPARSKLHDYGSIQEFQELQKQQQLMNGNAWAQQKGWSRSSSQVAIDEIDTPVTTVADAIGAFESAGRTPSSVMEAKTPKKAKKNVPAPLKLVPASANKAIPTQRESLENRKHGLLQAQMEQAAHESNDDYNAKLRESEDDSTTEHVPRPKSPGKKLFQMFFRSHTSSETPPKISPEWETTPEKAVKILGKESLTRNKGRKASKKHSGEDKKLLEDLDFVCAGEGQRSRADTLSSTIPSTPSTTDSDAPTDREIRSIGGYSRYATRIPTTAVQRTVSDTATINTISAAIDGKYNGANNGEPLDEQHKHLRYINNAIPPTPPSKETGPRKMRPPITDVPPMDVRTVLNDRPNTPHTAFRVISNGEKPSPLPPHLGRFGGSEYLNLVLNKPSALSSLHGTPSVRSAYGFIISPSAELANGSTFASPGSHFIESPVLPRSARLPRSRDVSEGSEGTSPGGGRAPSRRWSDSSVAAWKAQAELAVPCLPPTFYSPRGYIAPAGYREFTRPSANDDPSLYYLPQTSAGGELESFASHTSSEGKPTPPTSGNSPSSSSQKHSQGSNKNNAPVTQPKKFLVRKRSASNIAAAARKHAVHGLGLSPFLEEAMHQVSKSSDEFAEVSYPGGPPSAMPPPLNVTRPSSMESLPADEELNAFLAVHMHVDSATNAIHHFIDHKFDQTVHTDTAKHDEMVKTLHASFEDVFSKIDGVDEHVRDLNGGLADFKSEMSDKMANLVTMLQENVLNPMGKMIETNAHLDKSVGQLILRIADLEKQQKELQACIHSADERCGQHVKLPSMESDISPHPSATTLPSPHHSYSGQPYAPAVSYPTAYGGHPATAAGGHMYQYFPFESFTNGHGTPTAFQIAQGWSGQHVPESFAKMSREQRAQRMQAQYGNGVHLPTHPALRNGRVSDSELEFGKDGMGV